MSNNKIKPVDMESDILRKIKKDLTDGLNLLLARMEKFDSDEAALTLKIGISRKDAGGLIIPTFKHKVTSAVQVKDERDGELGGNYSLEKNKQNGYDLIVLDEQMEMFEEAVE